MTTKPIALRIRNAYERQLAEIAEFHGTTVDEERAAAWQSFIDAHRDEITAWKESPNQIPVIVRTQLMSSLKPVNISEVHLDELTTLGHVLGETLNGVVDLAFGAYVHDVALADPMHFDHRRRAALESRSMERLTGTN